MLFRKRNTTTELPYLKEVCFRLDGDLVVDDDGVAVSCVVPEKGISLTYMNNGDYYILSFITSDFTVSVGSKDRPDFYFDDVDNELETIEVQKPIYLKAFRPPE